MSTYITKVKGTAKRVNMHYASELTVLSALLVMSLLFSVLSPYFLTVRNIMNIGLYSAFVGIVATAMTMVLVSGAIDLSVGSIMALCGMVVATSITKDGGILIPILLGLLVGVGCGLFNGLLITRAKINPFITSISTMLIFRGFAYLYTGGVSVLISNTGFKQLGRGYVLGLPNPLIIMVVAFLIFSFMLKKTEFGRSVYSIGGNAKASYLAGINVRKTRLLIAIVTGLMAGLSGILMAAQSGAGLPQAADGLQMDIIASVILGGTSLMGGKGKIVGTFLGVLILATLNNGLVLLNVPSFWQMVAKGMVLLIAVIFDVLRNGGYE